MRKAMAQRGANRAATLMSLVCLAGCGLGGPDVLPQGELSEGYEAPPSTDHLPVVSHPEFVAWNRFPVGAGVVRKKEVSNDSGTVRVTTTLRLAKKTADNIVVESQVTIERPGQLLIENPPLNLEFPASFRLPADMTP